MTIKKSLLLAGLLTGLCFVPAQAAQTPKGTAYDKRIQYVNYNADDVVRIRTGIGKAVLVQLAADERFVGDSTGLATGNSAAWKVSVQGSNIFFKPAMSSPRTNMVLATNKRTYVFDLALAGKGQAQTYVLRFRYPEDIRKQQLADEAKRRTAGTMKELYPDTTHGFRNYDFWAFGEKSLAPTAMWDDGRFTCLRFNNARDMPAVFKVSPDGTESTVNSHVDMDTLVVHDTSALFHLRLGKSVLGVENRSYDSTGQFNYRGTTIPDTVRMKKGAQK